MFEVMHREEQPATRAAPGGRWQTRFPKAILERAPLDATCRCQLLHAYGTVGLLQAIPECRQELWRHVGLQFLENPFGDNRPVCVRHHSPCNRSEERGTQRA